MNKELNRLIDENLALLFRAENQGLRSADFVENKDLSPSIIAELEKLDFIESENDGELHLLTAYGHQIIDEGGWYAIMLDKEQPEYIPDFGMRLMNELEQFMDAGSSKKEQYKKVKKKLFIFLFAGALVATVYVVMTPDYRSENETDFERERKEHVKMLLRDHKQEVDSIRSLKR